MIQPPGFRGAAFGSAAQGDPKRDDAAKRTIAAALGISARWAITRQVHGKVVRFARRPGTLGDGDGIVTGVAGLPVAVVTADCVPVVLESPDAVGIGHAGWRGAAGGVVGAVREAIAGVGRPVQRAAIGPAIGPCCFEVGPEVAEVFPDQQAVTTWGTASVDLAAAVASQLEGIDTWSAGICTMCDPRYHSYRRDGTRLRQVAVAWLPAD